MRLSLKTPKTAIMAGLMLLNFSAFAADASEATQEPSRLRVFGRAGLAAGGDTVASGSYVNTGSTWDVRAGAGAIFAIGGEYQVTDQWSFQLTVGRQSEKTDASDGEIKLSRAPREAVVFYGVAPQWELGAGLRQDKNIEVTWRKDGGAAGASKFEDANGVVLEAQYLFSPRDRKSQRSLQAGLSLRLVRQDLKNNNWQKTYNANQVGLSAFFYY